MTAKGFASAEQDIERGRFESALAALYSEWTSWVPRDEPRLTIFHALVSQIRDQASGEPRDAAERFLQNIDIQLGVAHPVSPSVLVLDRSDPKRRLYRAPSGQVFSAALRAVAELSYTITHSDRASGVISFNTGISLFSWGGQNVTVTVEALDPQKTRVVIGGKAAQSGNPFSGGAGQVYTFGELKAIAGKVFGKIETTLHEGSVDEQKVADAEVIPSQDGLAVELERLADLHERGALSDDEFSAAKAKLLEGT